MDKNCLDRSHRLGKFKKDKCRPIIIRFAKYNDRNKFIKSTIIYNKDKDADKKIIFREHLTESRLEMFKECLTLRFKKKIKSVYTSDGFFHIKINADDEKYKIIHDRAEFELLKKSNGI